MTRRCHHCQAENTVADGLAADATPMCMRCGQPMSSPPQAAEPATGATVGAASAPPSAAGGPETAGQGARAAAVPPPPTAPVPNDFDGSGSTVMVQRPQLAALHDEASKSAATPVHHAPAAPAAEEESWHAVIDGAQAGPMTATALAYQFQRQKVTPASLLWRSGMAAWTPLENLPEVLAALRAAPQVGADGAGVQALLHLVEEEVKRAPPAAPAAPTPAASPAAAAKGGPQTTKTTVVARPSAADLAPKGRRRLWVWGTAAVAAAAAVALAVGLGGRQRAEAPATAAASQVNPPPAAPPAPGATPPPATDTRDAGKAAGAAASGTSPADPQLPAAPSEVAPDREDAPAKKHHNARRPGHSRRHSRRHHSHD